MKCTKYLALTLVALLFAQPFARSQVIVHDPVNAKIAIDHHVDEIFKLIAMIKEIETTKEWLGNAGKVLKLVGIDEVFANLQSVGVGQSRVDLALAATSADGATYAGDGNYTPVGETFLTRSGDIVTRPDVFKPESAVFNAVRDHDAVYEDVMIRRQTLRYGLHQTLAQLQAATTHAEVLKATGLLLAQHAELGATDRELEFATQKALLLDIQNRADKDRQEKALQQEQAREFGEGLRVFGDAVRPPMFRAPSRAPYSAE